MKKPLTTNQGSADFARLVALAQVHAILTTVGTSD